MDEALCKEIQYRVEKYLAPGAKKPGIIKLSYIWGLWRDETTKEEIRKCLEQTGAVARKRGDDVFFIYPSIAREAYELCRDNYQRMTEDIEERKRDVEALGKEMKTILELREIWLTGFGEVKLGDLEDKVSPATISSFISKKFQIEEGRIRFCEEKIESARKELEDKVRALKAKIKNLTEKLEYV